MSGSGGGGGYEYQAKATAYVAAHILAGSCLKWIEHENPDVPVAVAEETGGAGDDLHIVLDDSTEIELQAKHGLKKNDKFWQAILKLGQGLKDNENLYGVLLTDSTASKVLREDLRCDLKRIGQGRKDGLKPITKELQHKFAAADLPTESPDLFRRLRIVVVDLDDDLPDGKQAYLLLKEFLHDNSQSSITWSTLCQEGQYLLSNRGRRDSAGWARLLSGKGIQMKLSYAQVNHVRMPQEKQYLDNLISQFEYDWWQESFKFLYEVDAVDEDSWKPFELKGLIYYKGKKLKNAEEPEPVLELIETSQHQQILIVGHSGMGKSTLMRRLLGIKAKEALDDEEIPIPVLVSLSTSGKVTELIQSSLTNAGMFLTIEEIQKKLADRKLLLLLDGLNEVTDPTMLADLKNNFSNAPMFVTTREIHRDLGIETQLKIEPLKSSDIEDFFYQNLDGNSSQIQKLCDQMKDFSTPLMIWMLYCIFQMMQETIPATRGEAYQLFTTIYEEKAKQEFSLEVLREGMRKLAVEMTNRKNCLLESEAKQLVTIPVFAKLKASHLLQCKSSGRENKVEFCHPSIQEYYTAEYLISDHQKFESWFEVEVGQEYSILQQDYLNYTKWTEPIALMVGLPEITQSQSEEIIKQALNVDSILGAQLVGDVKWEFQRRMISMIGEKSIPDWFRIFLLGKTRSKEAVDELIKIIKNPDPAIRRKAVWASRELNRECIIPIINAAIKDPDSQVRETAIRVVSEVDIDWSVSIAEEIMSKELVASVREMVVNFILGKSNSDISILLLVQAKQDKEDNVRVMAEYYLKSIRTDILIDSLSKALDNGKNNTYLRKLIIGTLGELGDTSVLPNLFKAQLDLNSGIYHEATWALQKIMGRVNKREDDLENCRKKQLQHQIDEWFVHLKSESPIPRGNAVLGLKNLPDKKIATEIMSQSLNDSHHYVRGHAIHGLAELTGKESIFELIKALDDQHCDVRGQASQELVNFKQVLPNGLQISEDTILRLIKVLEEEKDAYIRFRTLRTLTDLCYVFSNLPMGEKIEDIFLHVSDDPDRDLRCNAAQGLRNFYSEKVVVKLFQMLNDIDSVVTLSASESLKKIPCENTVKYLPNLVEVVLGSEEGFALDAMLAIQFNCKFYNYEIQQAKLRKADRTSLEGGGGDRSSLAKIEDKLETIDRSINKMSEPSRTFHIQGNYIEKVEGGYHEHNYAPQANLKETEQLTQLLQKLRQQHPNATDAELFEILLNGFQTMPQKNPQNWQSWQNILSILFAGGVEGVKLVCPPAGIPIEIFKRLYDIYQKNQKQLPGN